MAWAKAPYSLPCRWQPCSPIDSVPLGLGSRCCGSRGLGHTQASVDLNSSLINTHGQETRIQVRLWPPSCSLASLPAWPSPGKHPSVCLQQGKGTGWWRQLLGGRKLQLDRIVDQLSAGDLSPQSVRPVGPNIGNLAQQPDFITYTALHPTYYPCRKVKER